VNKKNARIRLATARRVRTAIIAVLTAKGKQKPQTLFATAAIPPARRTEWKAAFSLVASGGFLILYLQLIYNLLHVRNCGCQRLGGGAIGFRMDLAG
jgi:hypothetical protein